MGRKGSLADIWNKGKKAAGDTELIPVGAGTYTFQPLEAVCVDGSGVRMLLTKFGVVSAEDEDSVGKVCKTFYNLEDPDRIRWLYIDLKNMGVDIDDFEVESEDDLIGLWDDELIVPRACVLGKVVEKDGWLNMKLQRRVEVEDDEKLSVDHLKGDDSDKGKGDDSGKGGASGDGDDDWKVGDPCTWKKNNNTLTGKITAIDEDDVATVRQDGKKRGSKVALDDLEEIDSKGDDDKGDKGDDGKDDGDESGPYTGKSAKDLYAICHKREIIVKRSQRDNVDALIAKLEKWDSENEPEDSDDAKPKDDVTFEVGDTVAWDKGDKEYEGVIVGIDGKMATIKVGKKKHEIALDDLDPVDDGPEFEVGDTIMHDGKKHVVTAMDEDKETCEAKKVRKGKARGDAVTIPWDEVQYETD